MTLHAKTWHALSEIQPDPAIEKVDFKKAIHFRKWIL